LPVREAILDGETIALKSRHALPFQETMRRFGRKLDVEASRAAYPLSAFFFDCLLADGNDLTARPRASASTSSEDLPARILIPRLITATREPRRFPRRSRARHEASWQKPWRPYEAEARAVAQDQAGAHARPRLIASNGAAAGARLAQQPALGALDPATGGFVMLGKTFKGMTDKMLAGRPSACSHSRPRARARRARPELVAEIAFTKSSRARRIGRLRAALRTRQALPRARARRTRIR